MNGAPPTERDGPPAPADRFGSADFAAGAVTPRWAVTPAPETRSAAPARTLRLRQGSRPGTDAASERSSGAPSCRRSTDYCGCGCGPSDFGRLRPRGSRQDRPRGAGDVAASSTGTPADGDGRVSALAVVVGRGPWRARGNVRRRTRRQVGPRGEYA